MKLTAQDTVNQKERKAAYNKEWYLANRDRELQRRKENYAKNKEAYVQRSYEWRQENKAARRLSNKKTALKQKYGLSWETYVSMYTEQAGECKICGTALHMLANSSNDTEDACVDHCHTTGKVRGLLCRPCNLILGNCLENPEILANAIKYLNDVNR